MRKLFIILLSLCGTALAQSNADVVQGPGLAGTPKGGVSSVQGVTGGTPIPVILPAGASSTQVEGTAANGTATVGNPVWVCGLNGSNCVALLVDSSGRLILGAGAQIVGKVGIDQTIPGTTNLVQASNLPTTVDSGNGVTSASTPRVTLSNDSTGQVKATNLPTTVDVNNGVTSASTPRVTISSDSTGQVIAVGKAASGATLSGNPVLVAGSDGTNARNISTNSSGIVDIGNTPTRSDGMAATNGIIEPRSALLGVATWLYNNSTLDSARSGASANLPNLIGSTLTANVTIDPCQSSAVLKSSAVISITSATTTQLVAPSGSTAVYVCGFDFTISEVITTANTLQFNTGTGATCAGSTVTKSGLYGAGGITVAAPIHIASSGSGMVFSAAASSGVCAITAIGGSGSFQGILTYVQQ